MFLFKERDLQVIRAIIIAHCQLSSKYIPEVPAHGQSLLGPRQTSTLKTGQVVTRPTDAAEIKDHIFLEFSGTDNAVELNTEVGNDRETER